MGSKIVLKNDIKSEFSIEHKSGVGSKTLSVDDMKYIRNTMNDLVSDTALNPNDGDVLFLKGYHSLGDKGNGTFVWKVDEPKSNHNGGTVIDPTKSFPSDWDDEDLKDKWFNKTNEGNGCWVRFITRAIDQKWFGTKEDGVTNDTQSINKSNSINVNTSSNINQYLIITQLLDEILKIDGSGSKVDSDLLDGNEGTYYTDASNIATGTLSNDRLNTNVSITDNNETISGNKEWTSDILKMTNLSTSDPAVVGQLYVDSNNNIKISQG